jgi:hypothetical protein
MSLFLNLVLFLLVAWLVLRKPGGPSDMILWLVSALLTVAYFANAILERSLLSFVLGCFTLIVTYFLTGVGVIWLWDKLVGRKEPAKAKKAGEE